MPDPTALYAVTNKPGTVLYGASLTLKQARQLVDRIKRDGAAHKKGGDRHAKLVQQTPDLELRFATMTYDDGTHGVSAPAPGDLSKAAIDAGRALLHEALVAFQWIEAQLNARRSDGRKVGLEHDEIIYDNLVKGWGDHVQPVIAMIEGIVDGGTAILNPVELEHAAIPGSTLAGGIAAGEVEQIAAELDQGVVRARAASKPSFVFAESVENVDKAARTDPSQVPTQPLPKMEVTVPPAPADEPIPTVEDLLDDDELDEI